MDSKDPILWTTDDVIENLCHTKGLFVQVGASPHCPDRGDFENAVRGRKITGQDLLYRVDDTTLQTDLNVNTSVQRLALIKVIELLRSRSQRYQQGCATDGVQAIDLNRDQSSVSRSPIRPGQRKFNYKSPDSRRANDQVAPSSSRPVTTSSTPLFSSRPEGQPKLSASADQKQNPGSALPIPSAITPSTSNPPGLPRAIQPQETPSSYPPGLPSEWPQPSSKSSISGPKRVACISTAPLQTISDLTDQSDYPPGLPSEWSGPSPRNSNPGPKRVSSISTAPLPSRTDTNQGHSLQHPTKDSGEEDPEYLDYLLHKYDGAKEIVELTMDTETETESDEDESMGGLDDDAEERELELEREREMEEQLEREKEAEQEREQRQEQGQRQRPQQESPHAQADAGRKKLGSGEVLATIHKFIDDYTQKWVPGRLADEHYEQADDEYELWHEYQRCTIAERERVLTETYDNIALYEHKLDNLIKAIYEDQWRSEKALKQQCLSLESTIDILEQEKWERDVYEMKSPPPKPTLNPLDVPVGPASNSHPIGAHNTPNNGDIAGRKPGVDERVIKPPTEIIDLGSSSDSEMEDRDLHPTHTSPPQPHNKSQPTGIESLGNSSGRPIRSSRASVTTYNVPILTGTAIHTPTKYLEKHHKNVLHGGATSPTGSDSLFIPEGSTGIRGSAEESQTSPKLSPQRRSRDGFSHIIDHSSPMIIDSVEDYIVSPSPEPPTPPSIQQRQQRPKSFPDVASFAASTQSKSTPSKRPRATQQQQQAGMGISPSPEPLPPSFRPNESPDEASYLAVSRWRWDELISKSDRKRIVMKVIQEMNTEDRELIRTRIHTVKKQHLLQEIATCVDMMLRGDNRMPGFLTRDIEKIIKFTRLFLCFWLADDYFSDQEREVERVFLQDLKDCLADGNTDPDTFCGWVRWVMDHTFSEEALKRLGEPSQSEIIVISDDEGAAPPSSRRRSDPRTPRSGIKKRRAMDKGKGRAFGLGSGSMG